MKSIFAKLSLVLLSILPAAAFAQGKPFVITGEGNKVYGTELKADRQGNLSLSLEDGRVTRRFKKGTYKGAYVPRPSEVRKLQAAFSQGEFKHIDQNADDVLEEYGYLGWGDMIMYIRAKVALDRNKPQEALEYLKRSKEYPPMHDEYNARALAQAYVDLEDYDKAERQIDKVLDDAEKKTVMVEMFNLKGKLRAAQDRDKEAVLEYMKTVLLFDKKSVGDRYEQARKSMVELMKDMNDRRYQNFENL